MAQISDLLSDVRPSVPTAIVPEIEDAIRRSLITFCRASRIWRESLVVPLRPNVREYRLRPSLGGRVDQILSAAFSNQPPGLSESRTPIDIVEYQQIEVLSSASVARQPRAIAMTPDSRTAVLYPTPTMAEDRNPKLALYVVVVPARAGSTFPDFIREEWWEPIVQGALQILFDMPQKPWTDPMRADRARIEAANGINEARAEQITHNWARRRAIPKLKF